MQIIKNDEKSIRTQNRGFKIHKFLPPTVVPELMMEGRGLAERPRETPPTSPGGAVPSPLQSSCKVCSCPGMEMDFAVLGGLQEKKDNTSLISLGQIKRAQSRSS